MGGSAGHAMGQVGAYGQNMWNHNAPGMGQAMQRSVPQMYGHNLGIGNEQFDMRDPRVIAGLGLTMMGMPSGLALAAYGGARQHETNQYNKATERQMLPQANAASLQAQQMANFGGLQGGLGQAYGNMAYNDVLKQLAQLQKQFKDQQNQQESQGVSGLTSMAGSMMGGI